MFAKIAVPLADGVLSFAALSAVAQTTSKPTQSGSMAPAGQGPGSGVTGSRIGQ